MTPEPDRFVGAILGLAIGDALGYPAEFRSRTQILAAFPPHGLQDFVRLQDPRWTGPPYIAGPEHPPGTYTDDTQMTLCVAQALLTTSPSPRSKPGAPDNDLENAILQNMASEFVRWATSEENNRAPGSTCMTATSRLANGVHWNEAGVPDSKGAGSAMRVAPIGLWFHRNRSSLLSLARKSSLLTHGHQAAVESAAAAALLVSLALTQTPPEQMHKELMKECAPHSPDLEHSLTRLLSLRQTSPNIALSHQGLGEAWVAEEAIASALYCYWRSPHDFEQIMQTAINTDGDSDTIACIAGGIAGAALGARQLPQRWINGVENHLALKELGLALWKQHPHQPNAA